MSPAIATAQRFIESVTCTVLCTEVLVRLCNAVDFNLKYVLQWYNVGTVTLLEYEHGTFCSLDSYEYEYRVPGTLLAITVLVRKSYCTCTRVLYSVLSTYSTGTSTVRVRVPVSLQYSYGVLVQVSVSVVQSYK